MPEFTEAQIQRLVNSAVQAAMENSLAAFMRIQGQTDEEQPLQLLDNRTLRNGITNDRTQVVTVPATSTLNVTFSFVRKSIIVMRGARADVAFADIRLTEIINQVRLADAQEQIDPSLRWANLADSPNIPRYALTPLMIGKNSQYTIEVRNNNAGAQEVTLALGVIEKFNQD